MTRIITILYLLFIIGTKTVYSQVKTVSSLSSPNHTTTIDVGLLNGSELRYRMYCNGMQILDWSPLGLVIRSDQLDTAIKIGRQIRSTKNEVIKNDLGENATIINHYNQLIIKYSSNGFDNAILFRAFEGCIAFQYQTYHHQKEQKIEVLAEKTGFNPDGKYRIYQYNQESVFSSVNIDSLKTSSDLPSTLAGTNKYLTIGEAENTAYTKAELKHGNSKGSLRISYNKDQNFSQSLPFSTPWRTVGFSESAIGLHRYSELAFKLSPAPSSISSTPIAGKLIRAQLTTQAGLNCVDFAKKMNFKYIMFDAGWYGPERSLSSDPRKAIKDIDLQKVIDYGKTNKIGVILYVNYLGLQNYLDEILPLYQKWGISGIKFGFVDGLSQKGISWLNSAIKKVNDHKLLLNIHDNYKPTGLSRTYPYLLTQEGIRGDENSPDAFHTTTLPFTRFLCGAADFTFCYPNSKSSFSKNLKVSKAHQLALTVINFSPLQSIFWYGKPEDYINMQELEFFREVPTTWEKSVYLDGEIGRYVSVTRKRGNSWFLGAIAGKNDIKRKITFNFLLPGKTYLATIWNDGPEQKLIKSNLFVSKGFSYPLNIKGSKGIAMKIDLLK